MKRTNQHVRKGSYPSTCSTSSCQLHHQAIISKVIVFHFCLSKLTFFVLLGVGFLCSSVFADCCSSKRGTCRSLKLHAIGPTCWFITHSEMFFLSHPTAESVQPPRFHPCNLIATPHNKTQEVHIDLQRLCSVISGSTFRKSWAVVFHHLT